MQSVVYYFVANFPLFQ